MKHIAWDDLLHKRYTPPYIPNLDKDDDVRHFDDSFTKMDPFASYNG